MSAKVFSKPSGKMKGSQTMAAKGDRKGAGPAKNTNINAKAKVMAKVFKTYPQIGGGRPNPSKVVKANNAARNMGPALSQATSKRKLKYIGA